MNRRSPKLMCTTLIEGAYFAGLYFRDLAKNTKLT